MNRLVVLLLSLLAVVGLGFAALESYRHGELDTKAPKTRVRIERGSSQAQIGATLASAGLGVSAWQFQLAALLRGDGGRIKAGVYDIERPISLRALIDKLVRGDVVLAEVRIIEGWTFRQMREAIARHPELVHEAPGLDDAQLLVRIGAQESHPEGLFMPSTYRFSPGSSDLEIYRQSYRLLKRTLAQAWEARSAAVPLQSPYEALVLASIIEKETGRDADRDRIAAVFVNRLRRGMMLQSDPTTIYGLGQAFDGNLRRVDLRRDTPYNTYTRGGLPPTPIALAGKASLAAALNPGVSNALYFVARGDGSSEFSEDLAAHNRAVERYQRRKGS